MLGRKIVIQNFAMRVRPPISKQAPTILQIFAGWVPRRQSGKGTALLPLPPLRTGLDGFPSSG
jgi:hypothetical protein